MTPATQRLDVVVAGGGLAGLSLALQLHRTMPDLQIAVIDREAHPLPEAAHKVGESSVEIASRYFGTTLGLESELAAELPKLGLRFFLGNGDNERVEDRFELGTSRFLPVKSYQIDRGHFETALGRRVREAGIELVDGAKVTQVELGASSGRHEVTFERGGHARRLACSWVVDASGRASLLKRKQGLRATNGHHASAAWFRVDRVLDVDDWCSDPAWSERANEPRHLSTVHFMDPGYWVWLIPLVGGRTSVGIVVDDSLHSQLEIRTFDRALDWLGRHEPQVAAVVDESRDALMDFKTLRDFSYSSKQVFSEDRWCLTGDAGMFLDPLYSPGSDFIAISNTFITSLIEHDRRGSDLGDPVARLDASYRRLFRIFLANYRRQYPIMGNPIVMPVKVLWDFAVYWAAVAHVFCQGRLADGEFMQRADKTLSGFARASLEMQLLFREWSAADTGSPPPRGHIDYSKVEGLMALNGNLLRSMSSAEALECLEDNLRFVQELAEEILSVANRRVSTVARSVRSRTDHFGYVFESLGLR